MLMRGPALTASSSLFLLWKPFALFQALEVVQHYIKRKIFLLLFFFFCKCEVFFFRTIYGALFFLFVFINFPPVNKTNCFILHNTIKPLHVQYQCPITDYMYGKLHVSQIPCIKKIWIFLLKKSEHNRQAIKYLHV